jgi:hypothetical protein
MHALHIAKQSMAAKALVLATSNSNSRIRKHWCIRHESWVRGHPANEPADTCWQRFEYIVTHLMQVQSQIVPRTMVATGRPCICAATLSGRHGHPENPHPIYEPAIFATLALSSCLSSNLLGQSCPNVASSSWRPVMPACKGLSGSRAPAQRTPRTAYLHRGVRNAYALPCPCKEHTGMLTSSASC